MQILSGKLKKRRLLGSKTNSIRPAMALVRKSIFDSLGDFTENANVLDLCAGTGILGIEAISRGAEKLTLVDSSRNAVKIISKNLNLCEINARLVNGELPGILNKKFGKEKFNLIFLDPPYGQKSFIEDVLLVISRKDMLDENGLILIETELKCDFEPPKDIEIKKVKKFGNTKVTFLSHIDE